MDNHNLIVEHYLQAIEKFVGLGGEKKFWPFAPGQVDPYFIDIFSINLFEKFKNNQEKFTTALGTLNTNILRWFCLPYVILGLKLANNYEGYHASSEEMIDYVQTVEKVLSKKVYSDPFCLDGQNKIMSDQETKNILNKIHLFGPNNRRTINIFSSILQSYIWSIQFDAFTYGAEWGGPYLINSQTLIYKTYYDLNSPIWNIKNLPDKVEIFYPFKGDIDWKVDLIGLAVYQPDIWNKLEAVGVQVDGKMVDKLKVIEDLSEKFSQVRDSQVEKIDQFPPQEIIKKAMEVYYFMFKNFFEFYREDCKPPQIAYQRIEDEGLKYWNAFKQRSDKKLMPGKDFFKKLYDPRNNFTG